MKLTAHSFDEKHGRRCYHDRKNRAGGAPHTEQYATVNGLKFSLNKSR
jgi:hypothetical protein